MVVVTNYRTVEMTKIYGTQTDEGTQIREDMIGQWTVMAFLSQINFVYNRLLFRSYILDTIKILNIIMG